MHYTLHAEQLEMPFKIQDLNSAHSEKYSCRYGLFVLRNIPYIRASLTMGEAKTTRGQCQDDLRCRHQAHCSSVMDLLSKDVS